MIDDLREHQPDQQESGLHPAEVGGGLPQPGDERQHEEVDDDRERGELQGEPDRPAARDRARRIGRQRGQLAGRDPRVGVLIVGVLIVGVR
jgi:hypothetical protein